MSNIIIAIKNLVSDPQLELGNYYNSRHRANAEGDSLEEYIKVEILCINCMNE